MPKERNKSMITNDSFSAFVNQAESAPRRTYGSYSKDYEELKWTGLEKGVPSIIRFMGQAPDTVGRDKTDPKSVCISWIKSDQGDMFKCVRPNPVDEPNHILNRLYYTVTKGKWDANTRTKSYILAQKNPDLLSRVLKNGRALDDPQYNFEKGWRGNEVYLFNVIDRSKMDWHRENKHTMLLASDVRSKDDREYVTEGVSKAALKPKLVHLFECYGDWSRYDIALTRTGVKDNPYFVVNASKVPEEVKAEYRSLLSTEPLTEEEMSWERYDLDKLFAPTTATKFLNRMRNTIKEVDDAFGTAFLKEFEALAKKEKEAWDKEYGTESTESDSVGEVIYQTPEVTVAAPQESPVIAESLIDDDCDPLSEFMEPEAPRAVRTVKRYVTVTAPEQLPHFSALSTQDAQVVKDAFISATQVSDKEWDAKWKESGEYSLLDCPECGSLGPSNVFTCPFCGIKFES